MKCLIIGLIFVILCGGYGVVAEDSRGLSGEMNNTTQNLTWTMSPEAALALEKTYATDIWCVDQTYRFLKTGNTTAKDDMLDAMYDNNGTVSGWLTIVDSSTNQNPDAKADRKRSFGTWNELNQTLLEIISTDDANKTVDPDLVSRFETAGWNHLQSFETLRRYVDENSFDQNKSQIQFYLLLMNGLIVPDAYEITKNPEEKEYFSSFMKTFDEQIKDYELQFPDASADELILVKTDLETYGKQVFSSVDAGTDIPEETILHLNDLSRTLWLNYSSLSD